MQTRQRAATPLVRSVRPGRGGPRDPAPMPSGSALKPPLADASPRPLHRAAGSRHHPHG